MKQEKQIVTSLHQSTKRDYLGRMNDSKAEAMVIAKKYGAEYWDGDRKYGYGGYKYMPGRWEPVARKLIESYGLKSGSKVLDVGCGKSFLLYEMQRLQSGLELVGVDISQSGIDGRHPELKADLRLHDARKPLPFADQHFDLVITLNALHNLRLPELQVALGEMSRVGRQGYLLLESYRSEQELFNLQCWALTCESFFDTEEWIWLYRHFGYQGDFEFIYF